jgi:hypothetical protein
MVAFVLLSGMGAITLSSSANDVDNVPPVWAEFRYFIGYIGNLTPQNIGNMNLSKVLTVKGTDTNTTPWTDLGPWPVVWNMTTLEFDAEVDLTNHDYTIPWRFDLIERYGYNKSSAGGASTMIPMPWNFTKPIPTPYVIPNGTIYYEPGEFGNISLTVLNGSSGEPLEGVEFHFDMHKPFDSSVSGLETDSSGNVLFENMQLGLEGSNNQVRIYFDKSNFNTMDGRGYESKTLYKGNTTHYTVVLKENDLLKGFSPADGSTVKANKDEVAIFLQFYEEMNTSSVNPGTVWLEEVGIGPVGVNYSWDNDNDKVELKPLNNLKYSTNYRIVVLPRVLNKTDNWSLWRTFTSEFTTWDKPALVTGTVHINGTTEVAPDGTTIKIDGLPADLVDGNFSLEVREDTSHLITVWGPTVGGVDEYLYYGLRNDPYSFNIPRGAVHEAIGLVVYERETRSLILTALDEEDAPLEGASFTHFITDEVKETDELGQVQFDNIRKDLTTTFKATKSHYFDNSFSIYPGEENPTYKNVTLLEKDLPIEVIAAGKVYINLIEGDVTTIEVDSIIRLDFENDMDKDTMTTDNIKILGPGDEELHLDIVNDTGSYRRWRLVPREGLGYMEDRSILFGGT